MTHEPIGDLLAREITVFSQQLQGKHPLMAAAREGGVEPVTVASYLAGVKCLLEHTSDHLETAATAALENGWPELADFFKHKQQEEEGHSAWAASDLQEMGRLFGLDAAPVPDSIIRMIAFLGEIVRCRPAHYLGYILFAEQSMVQAGSIWAKALEEHCGIPRSALTAVTKHVELDQFHIAEGKDEINYLLRDIADPGPFVTTVHEAMSHLEAFCNELHRSMGRDSGSVRTLPALAV